MKAFLALLTLAGLATAAPTNVQRQDTATFANDLLTDQTCRSYYLIIARGSTEADNIGSTVGPAICSGLQRALGASKVGCQGIGNAQGYTAALADNIPTYDGGILTSPAAVSGATKIFQLANSKCPSSKVVAVGYSQGTAVLYNSIEKLSSAVQNQIVGVSLFGYTANVPNKGRIPNYPTSNTQVFCSDSVGYDTVCSAAEITVDAAHLDYSSRYAQSVSFLQSKL